MLFIFEKQENSQNEILQIFLKIEVHFNFKTMHVDKNQFMKMASSTGKCLSEALIFASTNPQYDD